MAATHGAQWTTAILAQEDLPIGLLANRVVYRFDPAEEAIYRARVGQSSMLLTPVDRAGSFSLPTRSTLFCICGGQPALEMS